MKPTAYKIGEGERKCLSKDMQEVILAYQEKNKAEYKTATETEIQIENRNIKRIKELKEENETLKKENELLKECNIRNYTSRSNTDDMNLKLLEENKKLKAELEIYKKQYKHTMGGDYIDEDLYDLDC